MIRVTLIGPDGCGKSAVTRSLAESMPIPVRRIYMGVNLESSNVMLPTSRLLLALRRWRGVPSDTDGPRNPEQHGQTSHSVLKTYLRFIKSVLRTGNLIAEECFRLAVIRWWLFRGILVIQDRDFFVDYYEYDVEDNGRPRSFSQQLHGWFLKTLYRKPDLTILLDVSADTMLARKQEGSVEGLQRRRRHYQELLSQLPAHAVVCAEQTLHQVTVTCRDTILSFRQKQRAMAAGGTVSSHDGPPVFVIGLDCITGLQTARILSRRGIRVIGVASRASNFCCRTNAVENILASETQGQELIDSLLAARREFSQHPVLIPCTDQSVLTISENRALLAPSYKFVLPDHPLLETLIDKIRFAQFAETVGFQIPRTRVLTSSSDAREAAETLRFPVFLKPGVKTSLWESHTKLKAVLTQTPPEMLAAWERYSAICPSLIAQEQICGGVEACFTVNVYFNQQQRCVGAYTSQKIRQWPPVFGTACLARRCQNDDVTQQAISLFDQVGYCGLGYLEVKRDAHSGKYLIIEPNIGRPTGRSAMADAEGIPLLYSLYCDAAGLPQEKEPAVTLSAPPLKWIHLRRDLLSSFHAWKRGQLSLREWIQSLSGPKIFSVASWTDPLPFLSEMQHYVWRLIRPTPKRPAAGKKDNPVTIRQELGDCDCRRDMIPWIRSVAKYTVPWRAFQRAIQRGVQNQRCANPANGFNVIQSAAARRAIHSDAEVRVPE